MNTNRRFSFRFWLCNLIFGNALSQVMAFGMIKFENILKFNIYDSRFNLMGYVGYERICAIFNELLRIVYGIDRNSLYFNEEGLIVNKMTFRFKICNLLYFGSLSSELGSAIRLLYALILYLKASGYVYNETCSDTIRCIIRSFDRIMY